MHESVPIMAEEDRELNSNIDLVSFDKIASKLIKEGFLLTALELHAELIDSGKELPRLRDFFSNPSNFEKNLDEDSNISCVSDTFNSVLHRTSSEQTFDSLDFARNSDDGDRQIDEKIAVLEFELRKARETIKSLRASLTLSTAITDDLSDIPRNTVNAVLENNADVDCTSDDNLIVKPYEKRALNFLVNEYLMKHNYKLTSITFCDENEDQDFESWDDVGLNTPKPPDLIKLYRRNCYRIGSNFSSAELISSDAQEIL